MINASFSQESLEAVRALLFAEEDPLKGQCNQEKKREAQQKPRTPEQKQADAQRAQEMKGQDNVPSEVRQEAAKQAAKTRAKCKKQEPAAKPPSQPSQPSQPVNHSEVLDFTRCQRPDGTFYGTSGKCRKGSEAGAKEEEKKEPRRRRSEDKPKTERQPRQRGERAPKKKEEAPAPTPVAKKPEGSTYKVRSDDKVSGPLGKLRERIAKRLGRREIDLDMYGDEEKLRSRKESILSNLSRRGAPKSQLKKVEDHWERLASAAAENRAFADRLKEGLPKGFKVEFDDDGIVFTKTTKSRNIVRVSYSPANGFHFSVNNTLSAGSVKGRRAQLEVAMSVRDAYNSVVRALPEGAILMTSAYGGDGKGSGRQSAYMRMGFSKPEKEGGDMFAVKLSGNRMGPASAEDYEAQSKQKGFLWFAEGDENSEIKNWMAAVFGTETVADHSESLDFTRCERPNGTHYGTAGKCRKGVEVGYEEWDTLAKGNYGEIKVNQDGTRVVKTLLTHNGKKGEFGEFEVEIATKMGQLGHSPVIHSHSADHIEMDRAKGATLWKTYARAEGEPQMNTAQATKAAAAIRDLHKMGFAHGDLHSLQFIANGDDIKLVDFGLSVPVTRQPSRVMQDLAKIGPLVNWKNPELANDPYVSLVNKYLDQYKEVKGNSKAAKARKEELGRQYLEELNSLSFSEYNTFDFTRCVRPNGTAYGTKGKCRKGIEQDKGPDGLYKSGSSVDIYDLDQKAEAWRKEAGLNAAPHTLDWSHDRVHVLVHEFLGGSGKIGEWIGQGSKSPTPAEETLVNMIHRAAALKGRGDDPRALLGDETELRKYFERDINFMAGRGNIKDEHLKLYFDEKGNPSVDKFIQKIKEMEATPGFDELLDAAHMSFVNAGDYVL